MGLPYIMQWGSLLPPFHKYAVILVCGFELCWSALTLAVGQQYYEYTQILFPIAFDIFDETTTRLNVNNFTWTAEEKDALNMCSTRLKLLWLTSTVTILVSMLCIVPYFFKCRKQTEKREFFSIYTVMCLCAGIFFTIALINAGIFLWVYYTAPGDSNLFFTKFNKVEVGEEYVTRIEQGLHCNSDEDLENIPLHTTCDFSIKRSIVNRQLLTPLLYIWIYGHAVVLVLFGFFNKEIGTDDDEDDEDIGRLI